MRHYTVAVLATIGAAAVGGTALADDPQHVTISATTSAVYDSNVAQSDAALASLRGIRPQDWVFQPGVTIDTSLPLGDQEFFAKASANYAFYAQNSQLNGQTIDILGGANARLSACRLKFAGELNDARTRLQDLPLTVVKNIETTESINLDAECGGPAGFGPSVKLVQQWSNNSSAQLVDSNFRLTTATVGVAYRRPALGELSLFGSYSRADFPDRDLSIGPTNSQDGYQDYSAGVQLDRRLGARIEGSLKVAYTTLEPFVQGVPGYSGLAVEGNVSIRFSGRLEGHLTVLRAPNPTIVSNSTYDLTTSYSVEADYKVNPRLLLKIVGSQETDRYRGADLVTGLDIQHENLSTVTGTARFQLSRRLAVDLWASYQSRNADVSAYNYNDNRLGLSFAATI